MTPINEKDQQRLYGYASQSRSKQKFSDEQIVTALQTAHDELGANLTRASYQAYYQAASNGVPHPYTIIRRHGKWSDALKAAGIPTNTRTRYSNRVSKDECLAGIRYARGVLGHLPSVAEYSRLWQEGSDEVPPLKTQGYPAEGTIRLRFDRWKLALREADKPV